MVWPGRMSWRGKTRSNQWRLEWLENVTNCKFLLIVHHYLRCRSFLFRSGECTRSCGGGIQWYARECNNPIPRDGGRYCSGGHRIYKSCNTQECPASKMDFRQQQCVAMNDPNHSWTAVYNENTENQCNLACMNINTRTVSWTNEKAGKERKELIKC